MKGTHIRTHTIQMTKGAINRSYIIFTQSAMWGCTPKAGRSPERSEHSVDHHMAYFDHQLPMIAYIDSLN